jgi:hypothetical protein
MAIISAIFSLLSRKLGDLLQALFGWSITGLFGRLPSKKQTALSLALILSILWPLLVLGCFLPQVAAWAVAFIPLQQWLGKGLLRGLWITLAIMSPLIVGLIVSWVAPSRKQHGGILRTVLSGFPLTLGLFLSFLLTFLIVPVLKLVAMARRWEDEHVYLQVKEGAYAEVLKQLHEACEKAGVTVHSLPVPKAMQAPLRVLRWFARSGIEPLITSEPRMLKGQGIQLFLYPADLLIRGTTERTRRVRAAMVREMMPAPAYLTQDPKAQHIEEQMNGAWGMLARHRSLDEVKDAVQERVRELGKGLDEADIPYDDWVLLYSERLRLSRAVSGELDLQDLNIPNRLAPVAEEEAMAVIDQDPNVSTVALVKEAVDEARALLKTEIALARDEAQKQIDAVKTAGIAMGSAAVAAILGLSMLLVALVMAVFPHALTALITGIILLVGAGVSALVGYGRLPKKPLAQTQERLEADAQVLKERIA